MREMLRFQTNIPEVVALAFNDGLAVEGRFGDQFLYTWEDDRVSYLPPIVREKLKALGIGKGDRVQICKRETKNGNRRSIEWLVERPNDKGSAEPASPAPTKAQGEAAQQGPAVAGNGQSSTNGNGIARAVANGARAAIPCKVHYGEAMKRCLIAALDAARQAEEHAAAGSNPVRFTSQDIQGLASTIFIQAAKEGWIDFHSGGTG